MNIVLCCRLFNSVLEGETNRWTVWTTLNIQICVLGIQRDNRTEKLITEQLVDSTDTGSSIDAVSH